MADAKQQLKTGSCEMEASCLVFMVIEHDAVSRME